MEDNRYMEATAHKIICHRTGDVSIDGETVARVVRRLDARGSGYAVVWVVTDLAGNYVTKQSSKRLAVKSAAAHAGVIIW